MYRSNTLLSAIPTPRARAVSFRTLYNSQTAFMATSRQSKFTVGRNTNKPLPEFLKRSQRTATKKEAPASQATSPNSLVTVSINEAAMNPVTALKVSPFTAPENGYLPFGTLSHLPDVPLHSDLVKTCVSRAKSLKVAKYVTGEKEKTRDLCMRKLNVAAEYVLYRLDKCIHSLPPKMSYLHPFERTVVGLSLGPDEVTGPHLPDELVPHDKQRNKDIFCHHAASGEREYMRVLDQLRRLRNRLSDTYSGHAKKIRTAKSSLDIRENFAVASDEFMRVLGDDKARDALATARKCFALLRRLNTIDPRVPTVALVGAPNVGKSSLVRELSTGRPEVQHYPFTTRSVSCGHVVIPGEHGDHSCQVTDTPGLLNRPDSQRKKVEMLTLSVLEHLPSLVVIFVLDPSGHCGTSLEDQLAIRQELRWRYHKLVPGHRWFDVATKSDVWRRTPEEAEALAQREAALEEALMIKAQAERLGVSEARVRAEMAAVEQGPLAEEAKAVAQAWRDETLSALGRLERHGDWTIEGETGLVRDGAGEAIGHVDEEGKMEIWVSEENEMNEVNKYDVAEDVDDEENVGLSEAEGEEEVWAELEALAELEAEAAANADAEEDVEDFLSDFESGSPSLATTLTGTEAAVQQQQQQQQSSPSRVSRKTRKATTTSMPVDPSSLSVGPSWSLAETLAQLPPRPRDFVDDDTHMYEVSVVGADAYRETQAEERRRKHMQIRRMFGLYDAATDAEADDADAKDDIEMGANANKESDVALPRWARTRRVEAARDVGLGLSECPTVNVSTLPLAEDDTTPSVADELITDETVPAAVLQGKAELDELRGALGWELRELCVEEEEQQSRMEAGERIEVE